VVPDGFNILALCAGGGGLELGIELAVPSARVVCVVEREAFACEVLASAHEDLGLGAPLGWTDLRSFDGRPWRGVVDCIAAGIPCQPHSVAGKRLGAGDERNLWPDTQRIIGECEPPFVFLENVGGAVAFFGEHVVRGLEAMGYRTQAGLFSAEEVGAPHGRERLFVLAYRINPRCQIRRGKGAWEIWNDENEKDRPTPSKSGSGMADAPRLCEPRPGREDRGRGGGTERAGAAVADAEHLRAGAGGEGVEGEPAGDGRRGSPNRSEELADAEGDGQIGGESSPGLSPGCTIKGRGGDTIPLFPPGPGDLDAWRAVLGRDPSLEPAVCGVADGLASRVDSLSMLGNGVVPLAAAYAFATLLARLEHAMKEAAWRR